MKQPANTMILMTKDRRSNAPSVPMLISLNTKISDVAAACAEFGFDAEITSVVR